MFKTSQITQIRNTKTGEEETVEQIIALEGDEFVYTVEGRDHEVRVNAQDYVVKLNYLLATASKSPTP